MERLLHYVWKYKLYNDISLTTTCNQKVVIIDPGIQNSDAGPDFFNAKIRIDETVWIGNIEIHNQASDWHKHLHDKDKSYDSVILHVVESSDCEVRRSNGEVIPQMILPVPESVKRNIDWLLHREAIIPCVDCIKTIEPLYLSAWMNALLSERLERKTQDIFNLLDKNKDDWNEAFYIILTRNFGFGINNDAFERLAKSLPLRYIQKQRAGASQVEAMLFGQAGMLNEEGITCHYYRLLQQEYNFLKQKFNLTPLDESLFKSLRTRPVNFPHVKLAQLAAIWIQHDTLFSVLLAEESTEKIKNLFHVLPSSYWDNHYHFRYASPPKEKRLGENALNILLINTVVPLLFAYGKRNNLPEYTDRAIALLESLPAERNNIVSAFSNAGIKVNHAGDSQALIQLKREYCEKKKCLYCRIGFQVLKRI